MIGLLLIFFIGKYFYELAQDYYKHRWLYGILGIVAYYIGTMVGGIVLALLDDIFIWNINFDSNLNLTLIALPSGILFAVVLYFLLKRNWKNSVVLDKVEIEDIGKNLDEFNNSNPS